jgi:hypothetical protein
MDISDTIAPKSDQLNAEDLLSGERTFTVTEVRVTDSPEQPVSVYLAEFPADRPWKPSKTSRRVLIMGWGNKSAEYAGKRITLYRDPEIKFGGDKVGGIKIRAMSHLPNNKRMAVALTVARGKRAPYVVEPLPEVAPPAADPLQERIQSLLTAYSRAGVTHAMLEAHQGRAVSEWDEGNVDNLGKLFEALRSGEAKKVDEFPELAEDATDGDPA